MVSLSGTLAAPLRPEDVNVTTIYLVSSCHLDIGYANTSANIVDLYFHTYFPNAASTSFRLRQRQKQEQLEFTTHSYLMSLYFNCPRWMGFECPGWVEIQDVEEDIRMEGLKWHAFPFNAQPEVYDRSLADFGFELTHRTNVMLDRYPPVTRTMSQRDVPGLTRSLIPVMVSRGVEAVTVGVNRVSMPPAVPTAFVWRDEKSSTEVLAMWHPHGYGGTRGVGLDSMVIVPGMPYALAYAIRSDNSGPPDMDEVLENFATLHKLFPNATIIASGYDEFVEHLKEYKSLLPVVTQEIGDTWIHGVASDPQKTARFRTMQRLRANCITDGRCSLDDMRFFNFSRLLLKYGEHTWGKDVKRYLHDWVNWTNAEFKAAEGQMNYRDMVSSWVEQREWSLGYSLQALGDHPLADEITEQIAKLDFDGTIDVESFEEGCPTPFNWGGVNLAFDKLGIHISTFQDLRGRVLLDYASEDNPLAQIIYETFTKEDYDQFLSQYFYDSSHPNSYFNFGKPGLHGTEHINVSPTKASCWHKTDTSILPAIATFLLEGKLPDSLVTEYGAPERIWLELNLPKIDDPRVTIPVNMTVYFVNKTPTRIPESLSMYFSPRDVNTSSMAVSKVGQYVSVTDVVKNGSTHVHSTDNGVRYTGDYGQLSFTAWDTNVVSVGGTNLFPTPMITPDPSKGFAFNIFNNLWGTNYILWWPFLEADRSSKFRFTMFIPPAPMPHDK